MEYFKNWYAGYQSFRIAKFKLSTAKVIDDEKRKKKKKERKTEVKTKQDKILKICSL